MAAASFRIPKALQSGSQRAGDSTTHGTFPEIVALVSQIEEAYSSANWHGLTQGTAALRKSCASLGFECQQCAEAVLRACAASCLDPRALEIAAKALLTQAGELHSQCQMAGKPVDAMSSDSSCGSEAWDERILPQQGQVPSLPTQYRSLKTFAFDPVQSELVEFEEASFDAGIHSGCNLF